MEILNTIVLGIITSFVASIVFTYLFTRLKPKIKISDEVVKTLAFFAGGDARTALNILELVVKLKDGEIVPSDNLYLSSREQQEKILTESYLKWLLLKAQQASAGQPATHPESKPEGGDKPQPEAEGRSR